jgi:hypothetical protein
MCAAPLSAVRPEAPTRTLRALCTLSSFLSPESESLGGSGVTAGRGVLSRQSPVAAAPQSALHIASCINLYLKTKGAGGTAYAL